MTFFSQKPYIFDEGRSSLFENMHKQSGTVLSRILVSHCFCYVGKVESIFVIDLNMHSSSGKDERLREVSIV
jgi:hypothetical protein